jgi:hypothetical protein
VGIKTYFSENWAGLTRSSLLGLALGTIYGIAARFLLEIRPDVFLVLSLSFLVFVPLAVGYLAVFPSARPSLPYMIFAPWLPTVLGVAASWLAGWEGAICVIVAFPLLLILASIGGVAAGISSRRRAHHALLVAVLPFVVAPAEHALPRPTRLEKNVTEIVIHAPPAAVWSQVIEVPLIRPEEYRPALFTRMGFPRPVSALLSGKGVGAVRHARFMNGVLFIEEVTAWEDERLIRFGIDAQEHLIPPTTLDPHVTIGGKYFDVLTGEYLLVDQLDGTTRLVLTSTHRVSTALNAYSAWWARTIMRSIQTNILRILKDRAEAKIRSAAQLDRQQSRCPSSRSCG